MVRDNSLEQIQGEAKVKAWNENWPIGTGVVLVDDLGERAETKTRSMAWPLGHGEAVVMVEGRSGGYMLDRITPLAGLNPEAVAGLVEAAWLHDDCECTEIMVGTGLRCGYFGLRPEFNPDADGVTTCPRCGSVSIKEYLPEWLRQALAALETK